MSPTVFREGRFRFFFYSREEARVHIHVRLGRSEAKFWVEPAIDLAYNDGFSLRVLNRLKRLVMDHEDEIREAWRRRCEGTGN